MLQSSNPQSANVNKNLNEKNLQVGRVGRVEKVKEPRSFLQVSLLTACPINMKIYILTNKATTNLFDLSSIVLCLGS